MTIKWEYQVINFPFGSMASSKAAEVEQKILKSWGDAGWELVTVSPEGRAYLKRETKPELSHHEIYRRAFPGGLGDSVNNG